MKLQTFLVAMTANAGTVTAQRISQIIDVQAQALPTVDIPAHMPPITTAVPPATTAPPPYGVDVPMSEGTGAAEPRTTSRVRTVTGTIRQTVTIHGPAPTGESGIEVDSESTFDMPSAEDSNEPNTDELSDLSQASDGQVQVHPPPPGVSAPYAYTSGTYVSGMPRITDTPSSPSISYVPATSTLALYVPNVAAPKKVGKEVLAMAVAVAAVVAGALFM